MLTEKHKENEKLDGASGSGGDGVNEDDGSPCYSSKVTSDHGRVKIQLKRTSDSCRDIKQNMDEIKTICLGPSIAWSEQNLLHIKLESTETNCKSNSDIQHTVINMLPSPSRSMEATKDDAGEIALSETSGNLKGKKRKSQTQVSSQRKKKKSSKNRSRIKSSRKELEKSIFFAVEDEYESENSDINIETESSSDSNSDLLTNGSLSKNKNTMKTRFLDNINLVSHDSEETHWKQTRVSRQFLKDVEDDYQNLDQSAGSSAHTMQTTSEPQGEGSSHDGFQKPEDVKRGYVQSVSCPTHDKCLMILVADTRDFEPKADETCQALADQFKIDITQVYIWSKVRPVAVEEKLALKFVACISEAISFGRLKELRMLLLDAETMQSKCDELQGRRKVSRNSEIQTPTTAAVKEVTVHGVSCIVLELDNVTDPLHLIRDYLKKPCLFPLQKDMPLAFKSQRLHKNVLKEELSILKGWFTNCLKPLYNVLHHPSDDILYLPDAETDELYAVFQSEIEQLVPDDVIIPSPVVVFVGNLNYDIVIFERYLEAVGNKIHEDYSPHPVICIFPVSNLKALSLSLLKSPVHCWSAFDPQIKPINYIVAAWD